MDVNPEYVSSKTNISNRELMAAGKAPVVPDRNKEDFVFNLHHIGQLPSSPLTTIPSFYHNSKELSKYFHAGSSGMEDLHTPEFEAQKKIFWKTYLEEYDKAEKRFSAIPFLNSKHKK